MKNILAALGLVLLSSDVQAFISEYGHDRDSGLTPKAALHRSESESYEEGAVESSLEQSKNSSEAFLTHGKSRLRRGDGARFTFYETGLGACGAYNKDSDYIVALNIEQWAGGSHCFEKIWISVGGKKADAQITDLCPSCPEQALDLSPGLFSLFGDPSVGVLQGEWDFGTQATATRAPIPSPKLSPTRVSVDVDVLHRFSTTHTSRRTSQAAASHTNVATTTSAAPSVTSNSMSNSSALSSTPSLPALSAEATPVLASVLISGTVSEPLALGPVQTAASDTKDQGANEQQGLLILYNAILALASVASASTHTQ